MFASIRKAVVAGAGAALAAFLGAWVKGGAPADTAGWGAMAGAAVAVGIGAGVATWGVKNEPAP